MSCVSSYRLGMSVVAVAFVMATWPVASSAHAASQTDALPIWVSIAQIISTGLLGAGALSVSVSSAVLTYRNNFGWQPTVVDQSVSYGLLSDGYTPLKISFRFWNRRKYAIVLKAIHLHPKLLRFDDDRWFDENRTEELLKGGREVLNWTFISGSKPKPGLRGKFEYFQYFSYEGSLTVQPGDNPVFELEALICTSLYLI